MSGFHVQGYSFTKSSTTLGTPRLSAKVAWFRKSRIWRLDLVLLSGGLWSVEFDGAAYQAIPMLLFYNNNYYYYHHHQ